VLGHTDLRTVLHVRNAGVATSSNRRRTWITAGGVARHHIIDPASGQPAVSGLAGVTVIAPTAAWAEIAATTAFLRGPDAGASFLEDLGFAGLMITDAGSEIRVAGLERFER
jgi:thiamine biosynthesis lipoprotein